MVKLVHEVWETPSEHSIGMGLRGSKGLRSTDSRLLHTFEAESLFEAFRIYYRLMDWGEWKTPDPSTVIDKPYDGSEVGS